MPYDTKTNQDVLIMSHLLVNNNLYKIEQLHLQNTSLQVVLHL